MAKGKASVSSSGASMSKYDVEVEARLQALEKQAHPVPTGESQKKIEDRLAALEAKCTGGSGGGGDVSERLEALIKEIKKSMKINL